MPYSIVRVGVELKLPPLHEHMNLFLPRYSSTNIKLFIEAMPGFLAAYGRGPSSARTVGNWD
jgi:hypothetical protein